MKFILIIVTYITGSASGFQTTAIEFDNEKACVNALQYAKTVYIGANLKCLPKEIK